jgi:predicted esterase
MLGMGGISYALFKLLTSAMTKPTLVSYESPKKDSEDINYYLFAHGLAETHKQALWYTKSFTRHPFIMDGFLFTYNYPDATDYFWRVNWMYTSLGQYNEIMYLRESYEQTISHLQKMGEPSKKLILFGVSRGAATVLNFVGRYKPKQVKALILEAPFDSTRSLSNNILSYIGLHENNVLQTIGHYGVSAAFWQHRVGGEQVKDCLAGIPKELPMLLICSKKDKVVPWQSTYNLYKILRENGHSSVHIFMAQEGGHTRIIHNGDGKNYQCVTHAFYKRYGCHYDEMLAQQGEALFAHTQPSP